jgi:hypothetical protein
VDHVASKRKKKSPYKILVRKLEEERRFQRLTRRLEDNIKRDLT